MLAGRGDRGRDEPLQRVGLTPRLRVPWRDEVGSARDLTGSVAATGVGLMARQFTAKRKGRPVWVQVVIGLLILVAVAVVAVAAMIALKVRAMRAPAPLPVEATLPLSSNVTTLPPPPPLEEQLQQVRAAMQPGVQQRVQLDVRPQDLASVVAGPARQRGVEDLRLYFGQGTVAAQGKVRWQGQQFHATVRLRPSVHNGQLRLQIEEIRLGRAAVPATVRRVWQEHLDRALAQTPPDLAHVWLEGLQVEPGRVVVEGVTVPPR